MSKSIKIIIVLVWGLYMVSCTPDDEPTIKTGGSIDPYTYTPDAPLKDLANFPVGNIVSASRLASTTLDDETFREILTSDFNSITAENDMKMANMFPAANTYDFSDGDAIVAFAKSQGMRVHGHTLLWHNSVPGWLSNYSGTDEEFSVQIENYVKAAVAHFAKEKMTVDGTQVSVVASWDVVNEAFDGTGFRDTIFKQRIGNDYVSKMFIWAREADPDVKLFYNDYNVAGDPDKRAAIIALMYNFKTNNIPIDGLGMQMHISYDWPGATSVEQAVTEISNTGLLIHFSEIDVRVNPNNDIASLSVARAVAQEDTYQMIAEAYNKIHAEQQFGITIWGIRDNDSWLYKGGTEWPLMYTNGFKYKLAHRGFAEGLKTK